MKRSEFIKIAALGSGGLMIGLPSWASIKSGNKEIDTVDNEEASASIGNFIQVNSAGDIFFHVSKHEMGQGVATSLAMILADELEADWERVRLIFPDADMNRFQNSENGGMGTGGSTTMITMYPILRRAGAVAREMLLQAAADRWGVAKNACRAEHGYIIHIESGRRFGYGELAEDASRLPIPKNVQTKNDDQLRLVGKPKSAKTIPNIVLGRHEYGIDAELPGMLYAVVLRCPYYRGKLKSFDATKTLKVNGVRKVVTTQNVAGVKGFYQYDIREGIAVLADSFWAAQKGREALVAEWSAPSHVMMDLNDYEQLIARKSLQRTDPLGFVGDDNASQDLSVTHKTLQAEYTYPYQLHSLMEPLNCTAHFKGDSCELHIGTQAPQFLIDEIKKHFGLTQDKITLHLHPSGGGYGRRWYPDTGLEALTISKEAGNVPVKMLWTREDDQTVNHVHCHTQSFYQASLDSQNNLVAWYHKELRSYTWGSRYAHPELTWIGYDIPNIRFDFQHLLEESLMQSCAWRSVISNAWAFGQECFVDEIAEAVKQDPFQFRLSLLKEGREVKVGHEHLLSNSRLINVLTLAAGKAEWGKAMPQGTSQGIAAYPYLHGNGYCAVVAEVDCNDNRLRVTKIVCAVDCGKVVNPLGANNQVQGGVTWALTALLHGGLKIEKGKAMGTNFHENRLLRMEECPQIEVHFLEGAETPWGLGEISPPPTVPAVLNAVYRATGKRIRRLPADIST